MNPVRKALMAGSLAMCASLVGFFEGRELIGYLDPVGIPTVCYGHTRTAVVGQTKGPEECERLLQQDLGVALAVVDKHLPDLPPETRAAFGSFVFNLGAGNFERSTLLRKAKAGDLAGACAELPRWNKAGGKVYRGLVRRRAAERELCEIGIQHDQNTDRGDRGPAAVLGLPVLAIAAADRSARRGVGRAQPVGVTRCESRQYVALAA